MEVRSIDEAFGTLYLRSRIVAHGDESVNHWPSPLMLRFDAIVGDITYLLLGIPLTLAITLVAYAVGVVIALPIAVARSARVPVLSQVVQTLVEFFRTTPPLMHIVWAYYALPFLVDIRLDAFTVVAGALACSSGAQMSEIFRGAILAVPRGQWDAGQVIG